MKYNHNDTSFLSSQPLTVVVASGPYTLDDSPHYEVLQDLFKAWTDLKPDVIIMVSSFLFFFGCIRAELTRWKQKAGPFVDVDQPSFSDVSVPMSTAEMLKKYVELPLIALLQHSPQTQCIIVPSNRDAFHPWVVFPQPSYQRATLFPSMSADLAKVDCTHFSASSSIIDVL